MREQCKVPFLYISLGSVNIETRYLVKSITLTTLQHPHEEIINVNQR